MVSSLTEKGKQITLDALSFGAVDFVAKPKADVAAGLNSMMMELRAKVKIAAIANVSHWKKAREELHQSVRPVWAPEVEKGHFDIIAIGASTGGTEAIASVLKDLPANIPPVVIVQHMPQGFTKLFADRMNTISQLEVSEAKSGDMLARGKCFIAPGGQQLEVVRAGNAYRLEVRESGLVNGHAPSVEVMMRAVAKAAGARAVGVMLTGMGGDGADGMKAMRDAGARTMAQDEATSVVFGMPKVAWERGGAQELIALPKIPGKIISILMGEA
jgi:two-component system chemotaxis response regulator CheB